MDTCNSESLQSSSGEEEEYDSSRSANICTSSLNFNHNNHNIPPPPSPFFDSLSSYLSLSPPPPLDYAPSYINCTTGTTTSGATEPKSPPPPKPVPPTRSSKKRSRASRRVPTTVLTTDTTNFRAMVQEFTGIPTPSFAASLSSLSRPRLDGFSAAAPPYFLRPFPQKLTSQPPQPFLPSPFGANSSSTISNTTNMENNSLSSLQSLLQPSLAAPKYNNSSTADLGLVAQLPSAAAVDQRSSPLMWMDSMGGGQENEIDGAVPPPRQNVAVTATATASGGSTAAPPRSGGLDSYIMWPEWRDRD